MGQLPKFNTENEDQSPKLIYKIFEPIVSPFALLHVSTNAILHTQAWCVDRHDAFSNFFLTRNSISYETFFVQTILKMVIRFLNDPKKGLNCFLYDLCINNCKNREVSAPGLQNN